MRFHVDSIESSGEHAYASHYLGGNLDIPTSLWQDLASHPTAQSILPGKPCFWAADEKTGTLVVLAPSALLQVAQAHACQELVAVARSAEKAGGYVAMWR